MYYPKLPFYVNINIVKFKLGLDHENTTATCYRGLDILKGLAPRSLSQVLSQHVPGPYKI